MPPVTRNHFDQFEGLAVSSFPFAKLVSGDPDVVTCSLREAAYLIPDVSCSSKMNVDCGTSV
jgi:hypothetical protein